MPKYSYTAKHGPGETKQGEIDAESEQDAVAKLSKLGYFPLSVKLLDLSSSGAEISWFNRVSEKDVVLFTRQLATLLASGVNIINGLDIIARQASNKYFKAVLYDITDKIKNGKSLSSSLGDFPHIFSGLYTSMIYTGEAGGKIDDVLKRLADFMEEEEEFKNSIRTALTYPIFVFIVGLMTVAVLLGFVIPRLVVMFEDMGQALPLPTKMLIGLSGALRGYWWLILIIIFVPVFLLKNYSKLPQGRLRIDRFKLKIAVWGEIILKSEIARLMRTLSLLLSSGLAIVHSLDITGTVVENQALKIELRKFKEQISAGASFSSCLKESKLVPSFVLNIVSVGEEAGSLEKSLLRVAEDYEREVDRSLKTLARLLEPLIILIMGLFVGFIVLSMLLPIFQINLIVQ